MNNKPNNKTENQHKSITDCYELVDKSVDCKMKPLMVAIFEDNEYTRKKIDQNTYLISKVLDRHMWVRDVAITILFIGMVILFSMQP
jgi:hypothetical protein